ncbi:hypothetical protein ACFFX0_25430 [Citricoccus parietis]|uniref:Uncharacterized protein n=1 Tax=Citricoccus parietis TaxID=592307 RepID=A0ABV5G5Z4_9MICC
MVACSSSTSARPLSRNSFTSSSFPGNASNLTSNPLVTLMTSPLLLSGCPRVGTLSPRRTPAGPPASGW